MAPSYHEAITGFAKAAEAYCRLIERHGELGFDDFILDLDALLPRVYLAAHELVLAAPDDLLRLAGDSVTEQISFQELILPNQKTKSAVESLAEELREVFGDEDQHYVGVNHTPPSSPDGARDEETPDTDVWFHSNASELAEMYEGIRENLRFHRQGDIENAARGWIFGFYATWGEYVTHLLGETFRLAHATIKQDETEL
jgi:Domain of unknown function (DUF5063)